MLIPSTGNGKKRKNYRQLMRPIGWTQHLPYRGGQLREWVPRANGFGLAPPASVSKETTVADDACQSSRHCYGSKGAGTQNRTQVPAERGSQQVQNRRVKLGPWAKSTLRGGEKLGGGIAGGALQRNTRSPGRWTADGSREGMQRNPFQNAIEKVREGVEDTRVGDHFSGRSERARLVLGAVRFVTFEHKVRESPRTKEDIPPPSQGTVVGESLSDRRSTTPSTMSRSLDLRIPDAG